MTAKVIPMPKKPASAPTINPPAGWKDGEVFGFLYGRDAQGQPVDLVRLSDLVPWLQQRDKQSFSDAVRTVMDAVPGDVMQRLFRMEPGNAATVVPASALFGFRGLAELAKARGMSVAALQADLARRNREHDALELQRLPKPRTRYVIAGSDAASKRHVRLQHEWPQEPGRPALLRYLGRVLASPPAVLNDKRAVLAFLAIPRAMAHALFCWGIVEGAGTVSGETIDEPAQPSTYAKLKQYHKANPGHAWSQAMRELLAKEEARRKEAGHSGIQTAMGKDFDMSRQAVSAQIGKAASGTKSGRGRKAA